MPNFRILHDNAADRATLTASSAASTALGAANLRTDRKGEVWRSTGTAAALNLAWAASEQVGCVALPFCNLTPAATVRVRATNEASATNLLTYSELFTNAIWTKSNVTVSGTVADPAGGTAAMTLTAGTTASRQLKQTLGAGPAVIRTNSIWLRRRAGNGNISLWSPDGAVPLVITNLPATWTRYSVSNTAPAAARSLLIEMATANDQIDIFGAQMEAGSTASSYYPAVAVASVRPLGYMDAWQTYAYDSGVVPACPGSQTKWDAPLGVNAYGYAGGPGARLWFPTIPVRGIEISLSDPGNASGYLEAGRLVCGRYWEGDKNADYNAALTAVDRTELSRTDGGDLIADVGTKHRKIAFSLSNMTLTDRNALWNVLWGAGKRRPVLFSLYPEAEDSDAEQQHQMWCRLVTSPAMSLPSFMQYASSLELEEV